MEIGHTQKDMTLKHLAIILMQKGVLQLRLIFVRTQKEVILMHPVNIHMQRGVVQTQQALGHTQKGIIIILGVLLQKVSDLMQKDVQVVYIKRMSH